MEVKEFQRKIVEFVEAWEKKRNVTPDERAVFIHLVEEVGELAMQYVNQGERIGEYSIKEVENAIVDTLMQLIKLAHLRGIDIERSVLEIMEEERGLLER